jgi:hypothetical protein
MTQKSDAGKIEYRSMAIPPDVNEGLRLDDHAPGVLYSLCPAWVRSLYFGKSRTTQEFERILRLMIAARSGSASVADILMK